jgi:hypothetical protein
MNRSAKIKLLLSKDEAIGLDGHDAIASWLWMVGRVQNEGVPVEGPL